MSKRTRKFKCPQTGKATYYTQQLARKAMFWIWSHDPSCNMLDIHIYVCEHSNKANPHWHIGHKSYYEKLQTRIQPTVSNPSN